MEIRKSSGILACAGLVALALFSGCGSSTTVAIPSVATVFYAHTLVFRNNSAMTTGYNGFGQLGDGTLNTRGVAVLVPGLGHLVGGATGAEHTLAFGNTSSVKAWGYNLYGQLGNATVSTVGLTAYSALPVDVIGFHGQTVTGVAAGGFHSLAIAGGTVYGWGYNGYGQVGDGTFVNQITPVQVRDGMSGIPLGSSVAPALQIAAGGNHSLALLSDGTVWAWGRNIYGELGIDPLSINGGYSQNAFPVLSQGAPLRNVVQIAAGGSNSYALLGDGTVWAWGYNGLGQLGKNPADKAATATTPFVPGTFYSFAPVQVMLADGVTPLVARQISAGSDHVLARLADGSVMGWGFNGLGQLGNNSIIDSFVPVTVLGPGTAISNPPLAGATDIIAFGSHSLAKVGGASVPGGIGVWYGWGDNGFGQLGNTISTTSIGYLLIPQSMLGYNP